MLRLIALLSLTTLCTCARAVQPETDAKEQPPNIVFILTDDQGYGDLGAHGNPWLQTPNLDALHDESVRFTNFHVATTCAPTRAGLMGGVNCNRAGAWHTIGGHSMLGTRFVTLADELKEEGYTTGIFGKWHLGDNYPFRPQDRGFDEVLIHGGGGVGQTPDAWNNDYFDDTYFHNGQPEKYSGYCTDVWFEEGMKFIKDKAAAKQPFFAYIATNAPHGPFHIEEKYVAPYRNNDAIVNPNFYGMIANVDENVGKLMSMLKASGLDENTLVIFMTDNGTAAGAAYDQSFHVTRGFNAGMRGYKGKEYEGGHRVPFFMKFPAKSEIKPQEYNQLTAYTDFMPTLVEYAGGEVASRDRLDGTSLMPLLTSGSQELLNDRFLVVDTQRKQVPVRGKQSCVMQADWRLINGKNLYNLAADPGQREDLAGQHPERVAAMQAAYDAWWDSMTEDLKVMHRIVIGDEAEPETLLTAHDWHTTNPPPWNQNYIRAGLADNGWWALETARAGTYRIRLYRYPPESGLAFGSVAPPGDEIPNGTAYKPGLSIRPVEVSCFIDDQELQATAGSADAYVEFEAELVAGPTKLFTVVKDESGTERGAYYVTLAPKG
ncbi:arylsulfatase [Neolewinella aurantiaca]|uniref:Arylsulfatase n=1 Tax=Neolewinella aurantiaca TaxID=2602767 RepID=A0A5C7FKR2_9BACT|nr:arylsulfatase [Neolewinella aurantiaca]TXF87923.1 arylsulfatase [Neolewinella aurantiaca]